MPIIMELNLGIAQVPEEAIPNFREVDWEEFREVLASNVLTLGPPIPILDWQLLNQTCTRLTEAIQCTIREKVPLAKLCPRSKRWWTKELMQLCKNANKLGRQAFNLRDKADHVVYKDYRDMVKLYKKTLVSTKKHHWHDWLEKADDPDIWTVHKLISTAPSDGSKSRIPALKHRVGKAENTTSNNEDKSSALVSCFFPPKPQQPTVGAGASYPKQCELPRKITKEQILRQLK